MMNNSIRKGFYCIIILVIVLFLLMFAGFTLHFVVKSVNSSHEFYNYTLKNVEDNINESIERIINVNENIIYSDSVQQLMSGDNSNRIEKIRDIDDKLNTYHMADKNLKYVAVCDMSDRYYEFVSASNNIEFSTIAKNTLKNYNGFDASGELFFFELSLDDKINRYIAILTPIYKIDPKVFYYKKQIGKAISVYSQDLLWQSICSVSYEIVDKIDLTDSSNTIRLTQSPELYGTTIDTNKYSNKISLRYGGLNLYSKPIELYADELSSGFILILIMIFVLLVVSLLIINCWFKKYVLSDVTEILSVLNLNQKGSAKKKIKLKHHNEFSDIAENINAMLDGIEEYNRRAFYGQQKMYDMEIQLSQMRINMLKSQVNPHFLYNTLGCIRSMAIESGLDNIAYISEATIDLLRYNLKEKSHVSLRREIEECEKYINVVNVRYDGIIAFRSTADDEALNTQVLKMIIQPILENSVYHGLSSSDNCMCISVVACIKDGTLLISVSDNGIGMSKHRLEEVNRMIKSNDDTTEHIGLYNVHKRIVMEYGEEYGIDVVSEEGNGCTVNLRIPTEKNSLEKSERIEEQ